MTPDQAWRAADAHIAHCRRAGMNPYDAIMAVSDTFPAGWALARLVTAMAAIEGRKLCLDEARDVELKRRMAHRGCDG